MSLGIAAAEIGCPAPRHRQRKVDLVRERRVVQAGGQVDLVARRGRGLGVVECLAGCDATQAIVPHVIARRRREAIRGAGGSDAAKDERLAKIACNLGRMLTDIDDLLRTR